MKRTSGIWKVNSRAKSRIVANGLTVATTMHDSDLADDWKDNADAIVHAINCHDVMLDALHTAKACLERLDETDASPTAYRAICDAIAKAEQA